MGSKSLTSLVKSEWVQKSILAAAYALGPAAACGEFFGARPAVGDNRHRAPGPVTAKPLERFGHLLGRLIACQYHHGGLSRGGIRDEVTGLPIGDQHTRLLL